jgi:hypothetical protein
VKLILDNALPSAPFIHLVDDRGVIVYQIHLDAGNNLDGFPCYSVLLDDDKGLPDFPEQDGIVLWEEG